MKFTVQRNLFINDLNSVLKAVSSRVQIPILSGIKLDLTETELIMTGSNADISIELSQSVSDDLRVESTGSIVVTAHLFSEIVRKLPGREFTFEVKEGNQIQITSDKADYVINGLDASAYPRLPEIAGTSFSLPSKTLWELITQTVFAVSTEESRPTLTGVNFSFKNGQIKAVATDSHRLSQRIVDIASGPSEDLSLIIPGKNLQELAQIIGDADQDIKVYLGDSQIRFEFENLSFYTRLLEGAYPDVDRLLPTESTTSVQFAVSDLMQTLSRASLLTHANRTNAVQMTLNVADQTVLVSGNSPEVGKIEEEVGFSSLTGRDLTISFNPDYMAAALRASVTDTVIINFTESLRPFTVVPNDQSVEFVQLITPIRTF